MCLGLLGCDSDSPPIPPTATLRVLIPTIAPPTATSSLPKPTPTLPQQPGRKIAQPPTPNAKGAPVGEWAEVTRVAPGKKRIALTFDVGGASGDLPRLLGILRERGIHITIFMTGKFAEKYPDWLKQAAGDGHEIANHTYSHLDSRNLSGGQIRAELERTEEIVHKIAGVSTKPYWRPPYGAQNSRVLNDAAVDGYRAIYWTLDSLDSVGKPKTSGFILNRVTHTPGINLDGAIILQHILSDASIEALPEILDRLQEMGLKVVTVSELLAP